MTIYLCTVVYSLGWIMTAYVIAEAAEPRPGFDTAVSGFFSFLLGTIWPLLAIGWVFGRAAR